MTEVKTPYNFVPAATTEHEVFKPNWALKVSHDIPFQDGLSGEIRIRLVAKTPIFIRNGSTKEKVDDFFSHIVLNGERRYFIPATSLKGMLRNVLEIVSRSRIKYINDHKHSIRQIIANKVADEGYNLTNEKDKIYAGYLIKQEGSFYIYPCGKPYKIRYDEIDKKLHKRFGFYDYFKKDGKAKIDTYFSNKSGKYKYEEILKYIGTEHYFKIYDEESGRPKSWVSKFQPLEYVQFTHKNDEEGFYGRIVCTGQATDYGEKQARKGEYVFKGKLNDILISKNERIMVGENAMKTFLHICRDGENDELDDWAYWKKKIRTGIPVFFRYKLSNNKKEILDFGLTFMYKEPVRYSIRSCLEYNNHAPDFVDTIFGYVNSYDKTSLKGRVMFNHAFADGNPQPIDKQVIVLAAPKSSYYPFYLKQNGVKGVTNKFYTYNSNSPIIRGFKRYPLRQKTKDFSVLEEKQKITSQFQPLPAGTEFFTKIRFHNLKPVELGGILSALTFHGQSHKYFHSLGGVKPFGYGSIQIQIETLYIAKLETYIVAKPEEYLDAFACAMSTHDPNWHKSDYWRELLAIAKVTNDDSHLTYMDLKDFKNVKDEGLFLQEYSSLASFDELNFMQFPFIKDCSNYLKNYYNDNDFAKMYMNYVVKLLQPKLKELEINLSQGKTFEVIVELKKIRDQYEIFTDKMKALEVIAIKEIIQQEFSKINRIDELQNVAKSLSSKYPDFIDFIKDEMQKQEKTLKLKRHEDLAIEANANFVFGDDFTFESIKKIIKRKFELIQKVQKQFTQQQITQIEDAIYNSFKVESQRGRKSVFHRKDKPIDFNKYPWKDIQKWIGDERAFNIYRKLIENRDSFTV